MQTILKYFSDFSSTQLEQLEGLKPLYEEWNQKINVISRKDMDHFYLHHVLHSLTIAAQFELAPGFEVLDLGTGGGFPGLPLAIMFPEANFLLADSINKKLKVIEAVADELKIKNITVRHTRVEDIKNKKFDVVISRAVAPLGELWRWSKPLIRKGKTEPNGLICLKGGDLTKEIFESGCKPHVWEINGFFEEEYFKEKFLLYQKA